MFLLVILLFQTGRATSQGSSQIDLSGVLEVRVLSHDISKGQADVELINQGSRPISGFEVRTEAFFEDGRSEVSGYAQDFYPMANPEGDSQDTGFLYPGQSRLTRISYGILDRMQANDIQVRVIVILFDKGDGVGDPEYVRDLLRKRNVDRVVTENWLAKWREMLPDLTTLEPSRRGAEQASVRFSGFRQLIDEQIYFWTRVTDDSAPGTCF